MNKRDLLPPIGALLLSGALVLGAVGYRTASGSAVSGAPEAARVAATQPEATSATATAYGPWAAMGPHMAWMGLGMMGGGPGMTGWRGQTANGQVDFAAHFIQEMIPHHQDAVEMADLALTQAEHPEIRDLATNIKRVQTEEIARMQQWYRDWYGTEVPPSVMESHQAAMGARGPMQVEAKDIDGAKPFDQAFIEAMIPHHQMAVMMSSMTLQATARPELQQLLQSIITSQSAEIDQMAGWYRDWYSAPQQPGAGPGPGWGPGRGPGQGWGPGMGSGGGWGPGMGPGWRSR